MANNILQHKEKSILIVHNLFKTITKSKTQTSNKKMANKEENKL